MVQEVKERINELGLNWNTILMIVLVGLLSWNLNTTQQLAVDFAVLKQQVVSGTADRYTGTQAATDKRILQNQVDSHNAWLQNLSSRLADIEAYLRDQVDK